MKTTKWFPFFKAGEYGDKGSWPIEFCREAVGNFTAGFYDCPAVLGHPPVNDPTLGETVKMRIVGDFVECKIMPEPELASMIKRKKVRAVSARVRRDMNGKGAGFEHIGFLDKLPPAIPELSAIDFSAGQGNDYADIVLGFNGGDFAEAGGSAPFTAEEEAEIKAIIERMVADFSVELDAWYEEKLKEMGERLDKLAAPRDGAERREAESGGVGGEEEVDFGGPISFKELEEAGTLLRGGNKEGVPEALISFPDFYCRAYKAASEARKAKRGGTNFSKGEKNVKTRTRGFITGADFSEMEAADFHDRNEGKFREVGLEKADFIRHRAAFSGDVETGRFLVLAERADFNERMLAGEWEANRVTLEANGVTKESFLKYGPRINPGGDFARPRVTRRQPTAGEAEKIYEARPELRIPGQSKADFVKNLQHMFLEKEDFALIGSSVEGGGAAGADMAGGYNSEDFSKTDWAAHYDTNRASYEEAGVTREAFLKGVASVSGGDKQGKSDKPADFSEQDWAAHYDANRKEYQAQGVTREMFLKNAGGLNANT